MTNQEILRKAIEKAVENGFDCGSKYHYGNKNCLEWFTKDYDRPSNFEIIFDHKFAKAFWGEDVKKDGLLIAGTQKINRWQYHLQMMVLEPEPLKYIEKFL